MRDLCHVLKVLNKTTKEDKGYITFADSTTSSLPFISSSTDGISPGPLMMKVSACVTPLMVHRDWRAAKVMDWMWSESGILTYFPNSWRSILFFSTAWQPYSILFFFLIFFGI